MSPWIIAHRGAMAEAPENTRAAFEKALDYPIDGIELDVQLSRDGVAVIFHDASLKKINGTRRPVSAYTYSELCRMDWGAWFSPVFAGEPILTLEETLEKYGRQTRLLIEIKTDGASGDRTSNRVLAHTVVDLMTAVLPPQLIEKMMVLSFDPDIIATAMRRAPHLTYALNLKTEKFPRRDWPVRLYAASLPIHKMNTRFVANCQSSELRVMTYSCNTETLVDKALGVGVGVIMTDDPGNICLYMNR
ncbi:MAG TPA: glycerophosphodiester phosphodiesterase family protein [Desulfosalsimonadaceae bacterium]|nr:glycerophosphodiester phosphodiesterase family protein [Desulfosalsimonadaceae bacterium]